MDGDFSPRIEGLLARAEAICASHGAKLTDLRRQVLGLILDAEGPTGAYELLDRLRGSRKGAAPPTVYRALDFLQEHGLVHRIQRLSAFVGCVAHADHGPEQGAGQRPEQAPEHGHAAQFLICRQCGHVTEIEDQDLARALAETARRRGFSVTGATIEAEGLCADCQSRQGGSEQHA